MAGRGRIENLKSWKPGQSGNPGGRPNRKKLTEALIRAIEEKGLDDKFVQIGLKSALDGDFKFWAYIFDRLDGKIADKMEISSENSKVVVHIEENGRDTIQGSGGTSAELPEESG